MKIEEAIKELEELIRRDDAAWDFADIAPESDHLRERRPAVMKRLKELRALRDLINTFDSVVDQTASPPPTPMSVINRLLDYLFVKEGLER